MLRGEKQARRGRDRDIEARRGPEGKHHFSTGDLAHTRLVY